MSRPLFNDSNPGPAGAAITNAKPCCPVCGLKKDVRGTLPPRAVAAATMAGGTPTIKRQLVHAGAIEGTTYRGVRCCRGCADLGQRAADMAAAAHKNLDAVARTKEREQHPISNVPTLQRSDDSTLVSREQRRCVACACATTTCELLTSSVHPRPPTCSTPHSSTWRRAPSRATGRSSMNLHARYLLLTK